MVVVTAISWLGINHKPEKQKRKNKWTKWGIGGWGGERETDRQTKSKERPAEGKKDERKKDDNGPKPHLQKDEQKKNIQND